MFHMQFCVNSLPPDLQFTLMERRLWMLSCLVWQCIMLSQCWLLRFVASYPLLLVCQWSSVSILLLWLLHLLNVGLTDKT